MKWICLGLAVFALVLGSLLLPGAGAPAEDTLTIGIETGVATWDCWFASETNCLILAGLWGDTLFDFDPKEPAKLRPLLATSWKYIDPTTLEVKLRQGVKFHNGEPFTAKAVKTVLEYVADPQNGATLRYGVAWLKQVDVVDDYTVRIIYRSPNAPGILRLVQFGTIYAPAYYSQVKQAGFGVKPIGTGPYRFLSWARDRQVIFEANPDYNGPKGKPRFKRIVVRFIPELATRVGELISGGVDIIQEVTPDQVRVIQSSGQATVYPVSTNRMVFLNLDAGGRSGASPLQKVEVRKAIAHAIDKNAIVNRILGGLAERRDSMATPFMFGHTDKVAQYEYSPAKAKQLLAEAGHADGFETDFVTWVPDRPAIEAIVGYLGAVGIKTNLKYFGGDVATAGRLIAGGKAPIFSELWTTIPDTDAILSPFLIPGNPRTYTTDRQLAEWLQRASSSVDAAERRELYSSVLKSIAENAYMIPLYSPKAIYAARTNIDFSEVGTPIYPRWYKASRK